MNILVAKNGSQLGPFSESDLRAKLASGEFSPTDYGWHEGLTAWSPLAQLVGGAAPAAPLPSPDLAPQPYHAPGPQTASPQPYSAPQTYNSPYPAQYQPGAPTPWGMPGMANYAGFWRRFLAYMIDGVILYIPILLIVTVISLAAGTSSPGRSTYGSNSMSPALVGVIALLEFGYLFIVWFYFAGMESSARQATFGKMAIGMKVTDLNGNRVGFGQATGRFFGKILSGIFLIGYIMAGFTERKQAMHDMMAGTLVVMK